MTRRREMAGVLAALAVASALLLLASGRTWARTQPPRGSLDAARALTGSALEPGLPALALVGLAAVVAVLATRRRLRAVVGAVVVLAGAGAAVLAARAVPGATSRTGWPAAAVSAAVVVAAAGALVVLRGARWPSMSARYDAPAPAVGAREDQPEEQSDRSMWDALGRGEDPTA